MTCCARSTWVSGLIIVTGPDRAEQLKETLGGSIIGEIVKGEPGVSYLK